MHCIYFLIHSICHSISGHPSALAGCAWPFQSVITTLLFTALTEHCIDRCWQGEVQMWRVLSFAIARIRFYTISPAWKFDIIAIIWLHYSCQSWRTFYLMLSTPLKAKITSDFLKLFISFSVASEIQYLLFDGISFYELQYSTVDNKDWDVCQKGYTYIYNPAVIIPFSCPTAHGQWCPGIHLTMEGVRGLNKITHIKPSESVTGQSPRSTLSQRYITSHGCHSDRMSGTLWEKQIGWMNQSKRGHWDISFRNETQTVSKSTLFFMGQRIKYLTRNIFIY